MAGENKQQRHYRQILYRVGVPRDGGESCVFSFAKWYHAVVCIGYRGRGDTYYYTRFTCMTLIVLIVILMTGGVLAWIAARWSEHASRWIALVAVVVDLVWLIAIWMEHGPAGGLLTEEWIIRYDHPWIDRFGIGISVAADGLSLILLTLTFFLGAVSVITSWREIKYRTGFFHFNLLWVLAGIAGVFVVMDLFLFYFFWEVMLIPMYFLIGIWGHENRRYAAVKFFIFTQASGLMMLL